MQAVPQADMHPTVLLVMQKEKKETTLNAFGLFIWLIRDDLAIPYGVKIRGKLQAFH